MQVDHDTFKDEMEQGMNQLVRDRDFTATKLKRNTDLLEVYKNRLDEEKIRAKTTIDEE